MIDDGSTPRVEGKIISGTIKPAEETISGTTYSGEISLPQLEHEMPEHLAKILAARTEGLKEDLSLKALIERATERMQHRPITSDEIATALNILTEKPFTIPAGDGHSILWRSTPDKLSIDLCSMTFMPPHLFEEPYLQIGIRVDNIQFEPFMLPIHVVNTENNQVHEIVATTHHNWPVFAAYGLTKGATYQIKLNELQKSS